MYCYQSVIDSLKILVQRSGFVEKCELWRERKVYQNVLSDIYDGSVWKSFLNPGGVPFLSMPFNFALSLNVDWFQPFKHSTYSAGAIYIAIQNSPREQRYTTDNILLVGVIPGPNEPKRTMNSYLEPLVKELNELWKGVIMQSALGNPVLVRAALICTACDIPASRKISGFVGHNARLACSRCLKAFPTAMFGEKSDYTGTDRSTWTPRTMESHHKQALLHKDCNTRSQQINIERNHGCRYSPLIKLPYYDVIKFCIVDPMHNLLLGTAKHMVSVWLSTGIIEKGHLLDMQETVDHFITPSDIGRIPAKIATGQGFSNFTAEQWRNWTLSDIEEGDSLLLGFCELFEHLYGKENYTINLHLHGHIKECMLDYGPVYSFWLFAFERLNGVLGSYHTNSRDISLQLMRRFISTTEYGSHNWPTEFKDQFSSLLKCHQYSKGSLHTTSVEQALQVHQLEDIVPLPPVREAAWNVHEKSYLHNHIYTLIQHIDFYILTLYCKATALTIGGFTIGSTTSRFVTRAHIMANHPRYPNKLFLGRIEHFARVDFADNKRPKGSKMRSVWTAYVSFYDEHEYKTWFGGPTQVWTRTIFDVCYVYLSSIKCQVAYCETEVNFGSTIGKQTVFVVSLLSNIS